MIAALGAAGRPGEGVAEESDEKETRTGAGDRAHRSGWGAFEPARED